MFQLSLTQSHPLSPSLTLTLTLTHTHSHSLTFTHTHSHSLTLTHTQLTLGNGTLILKRNGQAKIFGTEEKSFHLNDLA